MTQDNAQLSYFSIVDKINKANSDKLPLTATCIPSKKSNKKKQRKSETWEMHCDSNENGVRDEGEKVEKVKIITKKGCKVKKAPNIKCQKVAKATCFCANEASVVENDLVDFNDLFQPRLSCISGREKEDLWLIEAVSKTNSEVFKSEEITVKVNPKNNICSRKLSSVVKSLLKNAEKASSG